jgi:hypothetical protein
MYYSKYNPKWLTHTNKCTKTSFVIDLFIKRLPQYAFRHFYIAIIRRIVEVFTYTNVIELYQNS